MIYETERLYMRKLTAEDHAAMGLFLKDPEVMYAYEHGFSDEEVTDWIDRQIRRYEKDGFGLWAMILKETGELIGDCGITMQECDDTGRLVPEIGYHLQKRYWHQGYAIEAAAGCKRYAFEKLGIREIYSIIRDNNIPSQNVAVRNGMTRRNTLVKHYYGMDMPHYVFSARNYKYVLFDLDGTLTDPKVGITTCVAYALEHFGIHVENMDTLCKFIGPPLKESFMVYYGMNSGEADEAVEKYRERFAVKGLFENRVYKGIRELLGELKAMGKTLIVATSKPAVYSGQILEHFGLVDYFTFLSGSELDGTRVDKAEVIAYALEQNGITDPSEVLMVGDREHDIIGAVKNGIDCAGVLYGYGSREEFEENHASYIVETVAELRDLLVKGARQI